MNRALFEFLINPHEISIWNSFYEITVLCKGVFFVHRHSVLDFFLIFTFFYTLIEARRESNQQYDLIDMSYVKDVRGYCVSGLRFRTNKINHRIV